MESLILAQDERWRRASNMQVERGRAFSQEKVRSSGERVSNTWGTYPSRRGQPRETGANTGYVRRVAWPGEERIARSLEEGPAAYQLVGEVTAHQGDDG
jgi:hypothetical protein